MRCRGFVVVGVASNCKKISRVRFESFPHPRPFSPGEKGDKPLSFEEKGDKPLSVEEKGDKPLSFEEKGDKPLSLGERGWGVGRV